MREIGYRFETTSGAGDVARSFAHLVTGEESGVTVATAGRLMRSRPQGKLAFAELWDWTGGIQLFALAAFTPDFEEFCRLSLGDWIGVSGEVVRTQRGELSVKVASWELLARARRGFGDKWHGVSDPDIRYRQRELDLWANDGVRDIFLLRSKVVASIRRRLGAAGFVEVETPVLHPILGGATARPFVTHHNALHTDVYLRIATELYLKRCVVGGMERVFEIGRTFRNEGLSPRHNPEFTMLELYQAYADYTDMMVIFEDIVAGTAEELLGTTVIPYQGRRGRSDAAVAAGDPGRAHRGARRGRRRPVDGSGPPTAGGVGSRSAVRALVRAGQAHPRDLREDDRVGALGSGVRVRLPPGGLAACAGAPLQARLRGAFRADHRGPRARQRLQRAGRSRRPAGTFRGAGAGEGPG